MLAANNQIVGLKSAIFSIRKELAIDYSVNGRAWSVARLSCRTGEGCMHNLALWLTVKNNEDHLKWIIDLTIAYPNGKPLDILTILSGITPPCSTVFHYRCYPISEVSRFRHLSRRSSFQLKFEWISSHVHKLVELNCNACVVVQVNNTTFGAKWLALIRIN